MELVRKTIENDLFFLRQVSKEVDFSKDNLDEIIEKLDCFCRNDNNIMAMAAVQLGFLYRIIYLKKTSLESLGVDDYNEETIMINPKILESYGLTEYYEACASCLDYTVLVKRPYKIKLEYYDQFMEKHVEMFEGFPCTVLSHEIDHLDGILHIDNSPLLFIKTKEERKKLRKLYPYRIIKKTGSYSKLCKKKKVFSLKCFNIFKK